MLSKGDAEFGFPSRIERLVVMRDLQAICELLNESDKVQRT